MNDKLTKGKRRPGRPPRHGGYSLVARDDLLKEHPHLKQYLRDTRAGLVRDIAGTEDELTEPQRCVIDRLLSRLAVCRLIEVYIERNGIFRRDRLQKDRVLELEPALGINYLAFSNSIDRALSILGVSRRKAEKVIDLKAYLKEKHAIKEES